jgi:hypothetical protein
MFTFKLFKPEIDKAKKFIKEHKTEVTLGVGFVGGVAATLYCIKPGSSNLVTQFHHEFFPDQTAEEIADTMRKCKAIDISCPHGLVTLFASDFDLPIAGLNLTEEQIRRDVAAGILAVEFFKNKNLTEEYIDFANQRADELLKK